MATLLLRIAAPLQSWGVDSKFESLRRTERFPSKSGIVGLVASSMGRRRNEDLSDILSLRFGVRIDQDGELINDFHMVNASKPYLTNRHYLSDAVFLVGLEGEIEFLIKIEQSINNPMFPLFCGRRSCPSSGKIVVGIRECSLIDALKNEKWQASEYMQTKLKHKGSLRVYLDGTEEQIGKIIKKDIPISFDSKNRKYGYRTIIEEKVENRNNFNLFNTNHNPIAAIIDEVDLEDM